MSELQKMFERQYALQQEMFSLDEILADPERRATWVAQMMFALTDEVHEAAEQVGWKHWATSRHFDTDAFGSELIDALHFLIALLIASDWPADAVYAAYMAKAEVIEKRQREGHDGRRQR